MAKCQISSSRKFTNIYFERKPRWWVHYMTIANVIEKADTIEYHLSADINQVSNGGRRLSQSDTTGKWGASFPVDRFAYADQKFGMVVADIDPDRKIITVRTKNLPPMHGAGKKDPEGRNPPDPKLVSTMQHDLGTFHPSVPRVVDKATEELLKTPPLPLDALVRAINKHIRENQSIVVNVMPDRTIIVDAFVRTTFK